jgi:hypothetical protein
MGTQGMPSSLLDFVEQLERVAAFAVHLVDEGDDGGVALAAHLDQALGLRFHAVGRVDHHQRRVHGGQHAVGVFREVLVAGGVEQVDHVVAVQHLHHTRMPPKCRAAFQSPSSPTWRGARPCGP